MRRRAATRARWWILAIIVLLPVILYWPLVLGRKVIFWGTPMLQFWPWRRFAAGELRAGRLPLWNPYAGNGVPLLADHQSAIFYPPNLIFWILPVERAMGLSLVLHAILSGAAMYALARELEMTRLGGLVAALSFMFSGYMVARGSFLTEISALCWLPLLWLYGRRLVRHRRLHDLALLSVLIALQFLAGHAQTWFYSLCSLGLYGLWQVWEWGKSGNGEMNKRANEQISKGSVSHIPQKIWPLAIRYSLLLLAVIWGVALAGVQFLPTLELSQMAGRSDRGDWQTYALQYSLWPWRLITLLLPDFFGNPAQRTYWGYATYWEDAGHIGVLPFLFAPLAIVTWARRRKLDPHASSSMSEVPFFASLAIFSLLMALGKNTPFYMFFFRYVPGFDAFQAPARWLCIYTPAMALLAGVGADALCPSKRLTFVCRLGVAGGIGIALTTAVSKTLLSDVEATFFGPLIQFAILFAIAMLLFLWGQTKTVRFGRWQLGRLAWQGSVLLVIAADLILSGHDLNPAIDPALYEPQTQIGDFLKGDGPQGRTFYFADTRQKNVFDRYLDFGDYGPKDVKHWWELRESLLPDLGMVEYLYSANTFEPLVERRYYALLQAIEEMPREAAQRVLGTMNVAYILDPSPDLDGEIAYRSPSVNVYRNPYLLPRAYGVCDGRAVSFPEEALATLTAPDFDPTHQVILEWPNVTQPETQNIQPATCDLQLATLLPSTPNQVKIWIVLPHPGYLMLGDTFYPGWQAWVDGRRAQVLRANYAFRAVHLDAGEHEVRFRYRPRSLILGTICSAIALMGVVWAHLKSKAMYTVLRTGKGARTCSRPTEGA
jgi:hypothetical protein